MHRIRRVKSRRYAPIDDAIANAFLVFVCALVLVAVILRVAIAPVAWLLRTSLGHDARPAHTDPHPSR